MTHHLNNNELTSHSTNITAPTTFNSGHSILTDCTNNNEDAITTTHHQMVKSTQLVNSPASTLTATYNVLLNDSCSVEVSATQQQSTAQHLLFQVLQKIKASGEASEYCLVEHLEFEQFLTKQISSVNNNNNNNSSPTPLTQLNPTSSSISNLSVATATPSIASVNNKKLVVKTRVLGPTENLFILTHVWNKMREDKKDGFKYAKIKLTKRKAITGLHETAGLKSSSLAKHRMSLQPITSSSATASSATSRLSSHLNSPLMTSTTTSGRPLAQRGYIALTQKRGKSSNLHRLVRQKSFEETLEGGAGHLDAKGVMARAATTTAAAHHAANVISNENLAIDLSNLNSNMMMMNNGSSKTIDDPGYTTTVTTTTTMTTDEQLMERRMSCKRLTEVVESTLPLSSAELVVVTTGKQQQQQQTSTETAAGVSDYVPGGRKVAATLAAAAEDADDDDDDDEDDEDYQLVQSELVRKIKAAHAGRANTEYEDIDKAKKQLIASKKPLPKRTNTVQRFFKLF
jgi:hypothetical protein